LGAAKAGCLLAIVRKPRQDQCQLKIFELPIIGFQQQSTCFEELNYYMGVLSLNTFHKGCLLHNYMAGWIHFAECQISKDGFLEHS
jgi:hypothetical protein